MLSSLNGKNSARFSQNDYHAKGFFLNVNVVGLVKPRFASSIFLLSVHKWGPVLRFQERD